MSKYEKINYCTIGRYPNGRKYGIATKLEVAGYSVDGVEGIAICKRGGWWYVDHVSTGLGVVTVGCKTRDAALKQYIDNFQEKVEGMKDSLRKVVETFENAPLESEVEKWESVNFCTVNNHRFDKVSTAAHNAGLITMKADDAAYIDGGNINIIGNCEALKPIKEMIAAYEKMDTELAENISNNDSADTERAENISNKNSNEKQEVENMSDYAFTETTLTCKGKEFPCEYNISDTGAVLAFVIIGEKSNGRKEKQKIVFSPEHSDYPAALEAAKKASGTPEEKQELATAAAFVDIPVIDTNTGEQIAENAADLIAESENAAALEQEEKNESEADVSETTLEEKEKEIAQDPKQARGPVPEKTFIGETIQGNGWKILFDGALQRTRIIFEADPLDAARAALDAAGFYYSSNMNSWNKKLTFKAYRAAKTLSEELNRIYAA